MHESEKKAINIKPLLELISKHTKVTGYEIQCVKISIYINNWNKNVMSISFTIASNTR